MAYAYLGGSVVVDSAGRGIVHRVQSNVFAINTLMPNFTGAYGQWPEVEEKAIAAANKQLSDMGYKVSLRYPELLSNFGSRQKTQEALDIWNSRTPADIQVQIKP
jgi:hypothetical protein